MNPTEQQIAIAEWCGWKIESTQAKGGWKLYQGATAISFWWNPERTPTLLDCVHNLPNYTTDLNAIHEAELKMSDAVAMEFERNLDRVICKLPKRSYRNVISATAPQRAEALLRTLGKWRDE